jgi:nucleoid-associated protein YgaU
MLVPERKPAPPAATATADATSKTEPAPSAPVAVLLPKEGPAKPMQLPPLAGKGEDKLSLDIIEYGTKGNIILQGRAAPGATIDAHLGDKKVGSATADKEGRWEIVTGEDIDPGRYKLKLDSRNPAGKMVAQLAMPFERASLPEQLPNDIVIVQPGNSLWRIARRSYGRGIRYLEIYHANRKQVKNPGLIYPGQLLTVPPGKT